MKKKLVICGGGSSAHTIIPLLNESIFDVSIYTTKPNSWSNSIELVYQEPSGKVINLFKGKLNKASNNPADLFPNADYIILCMPVFKYREALKSIAPYINKNKDVFVGSIYGQGGFNWMVNEIKKEYSLTNIITFAFGLIPWICRTIEYGKVGVTYGPKKANYAAVYPNSYFNQINEELFHPITYKWFNTGNVHQSDNFISLTLSVDNQIIHTSRCYGLHKVYGNAWLKKEDVPMFYRDYDDVSANLLADLDKDYSKIRIALVDLYKEKKFKYMLDYLALERFSYQSQNTDIKESFVTSKTLVAIETPVIKNSKGLWEIDKNHRFFMDDIYYGICIAKWIAEMLIIAVPTIDSILNWAQIVRNEKIINNDILLLNSPDINTPLKSGIPCYYGYTTINEIID